MICKWCGKEFEPKTKRDRYCSRDCRRLQDNKYKNEYYIKKRAEQRKPTKVCTVCGKEFVPVTHNQMICSAECRKIVERERQRLYYRSVIQKPMKEATRIRKAERQAEKERQEQLIDDVYQPEYEARKLDGKVLHKAQMTVDEYNRTHGTNYSYGQYVHYVESRGV